MLPCKDSRLPVVLMRRQEGNSLNVHAVRRSPLASGPQPNSPPFVLAAGRPVSCSASVRPDRSPNPPQGNANSNKEQSEPPLFSQQSGENGNAPSASREVNCVIRRNSLKSGRTADERAAATAGTRLGQEECLSAPTAVTRRRTQPAPKESCQREAKTEEPTVTVPARWRPNPFNASHAGPQFASSEPDPGGICDLESLYEIGSVLGEGNFGKVYYATHHIAQQCVAIKMLKKSKIRSEFDVDRVNREIEILQGVKHPHIIRMYEIIETAKCLFLVTEFAPGGELFDMIKKRGKLEEVEACRIMRQLLSAVQRLHQQGVAHRDLKPENVLFDENNNVKLVDFGLSNKFYQPNLVRKGSQLRGPQRSKHPVRLKTACGSPCYAAPEMLMHLDYDPPPVDIWSIGVILFAMICGYLPFEDPDSKTLHAKIISGVYQTPSSISGDVADLLEKILNTDPVKRLPVLHILQHPWFLKCQKEEWSCSLSLAPITDSWSMFPLCSNTQRCSACTVWSMQHAPRDRSDQPDEEGNTADVEHIPQKRILDEMTMRGYDAPRILQAISANDLRNPISTTYFLLLHKCYSRLGSITTGLPPSPNLQSVQRTSHDTAPSSHNPVTTSPANSTAPSTSASTNHKDIPQIQCVPATRDPPVSIPIPVHSSPTTHPAAHVNYNDQALSPLFGEQPKDNCLSQMRDAQTSPFNNQSATATPSSLESPPGASKSIVSKTVKDSHEDREKRQVPASQTVRGQSGANLESMQEGMTQLQKKYRENSHGDFVPFAILEPPTQDATDAASPLMKSPAVVPSVLTQDEESDRSHSDKASNESASGLEEQDLDRSEDESSGTSGTTKRTSGSDDSEYESSSEDERHPEARNGLLLPEPVKVKSLDHILLRKKRNLLNEEDERVPRRRNKPQPSDAPFQLFIATPDAPSVSRYTTKKESRDQGAVKITGTFDALEGIRRPSSRHLKKTAEYQQPSIEQFRPKDRIRNDSPRCSRKRMAEGTRMGSSWRDPSESIYPRRSSLPFRNYADYGVGDLNFKGTLAQFSPDADQFVVPLMSRGRKGNHGSRNMGKSGAALRGSSLSVQPSSYGGSIDVWRNGASNHFRNAYSRFQSHLRGVNPDAPYRGTPSRWSKPDEPEAGIRHQSKASKTTSGPAAKAVNSSTSNRRWNLSTTLLMPSPRSCASTDRTRSGDPDSRGCSIESRHVRKDSFDKIRIQRRKTSDSSRLSSRADKERRDARSSSRSPNGDKESSSDITVRGRSSCRTSEAREGINRARSKNQIPAVTRLHSPSSKTQTSSVTKVKAAATTAASTTDSTPQQQQQAPTSKKAARQQTRTSTAPRQQTTRRSTSRRPERQERSGRGGTAGREKRYVVV